MSSAPRAIATPVVLLLLVANIASFILQSQISWAQWALWPNITVTSRELAQPISLFQPWQLFTYGFLHGGLMHLAFNMYSLWLFGQAVEQRLGSPRFALYYLVCMLGAGLVQLFVATNAAQSGAIYPTVGASGGVFGVLLAFGVMFPKVKLMLLFPPIPIQARFLVMIFIAIELYLGVTGSQSGVAHFAHLGGVAFGAALLWFWGLAFRRRG